MKEDRVLRWFLPFLASMLLFGWLRDFIFFFSKKGQVKKKRKIYIYFVAAGLKIS